MNGTSFRSMDKNKKGDNKVLRRWRKPEKDSQMCRWYWENAQRQVRYLRKRNYWVPLKRALGQLTNLRTHILMNKQLKKILIGIQMKPIGGNLEKT